MRCHGQAVFKARLKGRHYNWHYYPVQNMGEIGTLLSGITSNYYIFFTVENMNCLSDIESCLTSEKLHFSEDNHKS